MITLWGMEAMKISLLPRTTETVSMLLSIAAGLFSPKERPACPLIRWLLHFADRQATKQRRCFYAIGISAALKKSNRE